MQKVAVNSIVVTVLNAASQVASFVLFAGIAALFGANSETDAFFLAMTIPALFIGSAVNAITSVFIPVLTECRVQRPHVLGSLIGSALLYAVLGSLAGALVLAAASPAIFQITGRNLSAETRQLAMQHTVVLLPMIAVQIAIGIVAAVYNSAGRFWLPAVASVARFVSTLGVIIALRPILGITSVPVSFVLGVVLSLGLLAAFWPQLGIRLTFEWTLEPDLGRSLRLSVPLIVGTAALQFNIVVSRFLAAQLPEGSVSILDYASRISSGVMELLTSGVLLVTLADWSRVAVAGESKTLRAKLRDTVLMVLFVIMPLVAILIALREPVIGLTLQRGQFGPDLTLATATVLLFFLIGIPADVVGRIYVRLLLVWQETWVMGLAAIFRVCIAIALSVLLMSSLGVSALAIADTVTVAIVSLAFVYVVHRKMQSASLGAWRPLAKILAAALVSGVTASITFGLIFPRSSGLALVAGGLTGLAAYLLASWLLRARELFAFFRWMGLGQSRKAM